MFWGNNIILDFMIPICIVTFTVCVALSTHTHNAAPNIQYCKRVREFWSENRFITNIKSMKWKLVCFNQWPLHIKSMLFLNLPRYAWFALIMSTRPLLCSNYTTKSKYPNLMPCVGRPTRYYTDTFLSIAWNHLIYAAGIFERFKLNRGLRFD